MASIESRVRRLPLTLSPNPARVLLRPFVPTLIVKPSATVESNLRVIHIFTRVMLMDEDAVIQCLEEVLKSFKGRHHDVCKIFSARFEELHGQLPTDQKISEARRLLLGAYFTNEYSLESSALFNPSIVAHPDQSGVPDGSLRFILSLRATGEGHISSISFRSGLISSTGEIEIDPASRFVNQPNSVTSIFDRELFRRKLEDLSIDHSLVEYFIDAGDSEFSMNHIVEQSRLLRACTTDRETLRDTDRTMRLIQSNYAMSFDPSSPVSERVIFPHAPSESNGIEDARFVRFVDDDGSVIYIATYTAYDGNEVFPQLVETRNFNDFNIRTLAGPAITNKGLAVFPRKINGRYAMLGRQDSENIHIMFSERPYFWYETKVILRPAEPWEYIQLGNCGSPIETEAGWLVLTHGVGPMRRYSIGAALLDRDDPSKVLGRLRHPLLSPADDEREGYVPNVVYSCGAIVHNDILILPYAVSDTASRFATIPLQEVLEAMEP